MYIFQNTLDKNRFKLPKATPAEGNWLHFSHRGGVQWADKGFKNSILYSTNRKKNKQTKTKKMTPFVV
jgi:hypothetical protein